MPSLSAGCKHFFSSGHTVANRSSAETRHWPAKIDIGATTAAVVKKRTNGHEEPAALGPAIDPRGVPRANIV